jgi:hypothetical protein
MRRALLSSVLWPILIATAPHDWFRDMVLAGMAAKGEA